MLYRRRILEVGGLALFVEAGECVIECLNYSGRHIAGTYTLLCVLIHHWDERSLVRHKN